MENQKQQNDHGDQVVSRVVELGDLQTDTRGVGGAAIDPGVGFIES